MMRETSVIEIDLSAVAHNMAVIRRIVGPDCAICPIVKADAYGLGAVRIARWLLQRAGGAAADMVAVYTPRQAAELFRSAVSGSVLVLMPVREMGRADDLYRALICGRLHLSVHDSAHLADLVRLSERYAFSIPLHLEVDTGMSRGGCNIAEAPAVLRRIAESRRVHLAGIYTHFSSAETDVARTNEQAARFDRFIDANRSMIPPHCLVHAANSAATLRSRGFHKSMVRIGAAWAGYGPELISDRSLLPEAFQLRPAVTWTSTIVHLKTIEPGTPVGYGATWTARRRSVIGLVPVGYADGYPNALGGAGRAMVLVSSDEPGGARRRFVPVVGAINMDQITVDLTDLGPSCLSRISVGTPVELITPDRNAPNHLPTLAAAAGTSFYELICRLSPSIRRAYRCDAPAVDVFPEATRAAAAG